ncbi:hypothetical protein CNR22_01230 [Sphingobacteriaceae bacterium]|nr:hypothetical protein CNR22_01230 [Sphingobacteriaceae bacterium]
MSIGLTKEEYWKKWEFFELIDDLHKAEELLSNFTGGHSGEFSSAEHFRETFVDAIDDIEGGNQTDLTRFYIWFLPTSTWDDFTKDQGQELGNKIFERVDSWKKANS